MQSLTVFTCLLAKPNLSRGIFKPFCLAGHVNLKMSWRLSVSNQDRLNNTTAVYLLLFNYYRFQALLPVGQLTGATDQKMKDMAAQFEDAKFKTCNTAQEYFEQIDKKVKDLIKRHEIIINSRRIQLFS